MSGRPLLKLKFSHTGKPATETSPSTPTPSSAVPKIKFKTKGSSSVAATPVEEVAPPASTTPAAAKKSKAGRAQKPSAKALEAKKRPASDSEDEPAAGHHPRSSKSSAPVSKKLRLSFGPKTPVIVKPKFKGKPPKRPLGEGYDSEASDREIDPVIEEEFILRMQEGSDCDYLRKAIEDRLIGVPRAQGGADVQMKFFDGDGRRACVTIRGHHYAATLVDLPCVIEGMKSWDKRGWWKSADICQMLYVFAPIAKEDMARTIELPKIVDPNTHQFPHGLTPPMHYARKRRFRKRISRNAIEAVEEAVEKLLEADAAAESSRYEVIDPDANRRRSTYSAEMDEEDVDHYFGEEDAEGEVDDENYFGQVDANGDADGMAEDMAADLEADLEAALEADLFEEGGTPAAEVEVVGTPDASSVLAGTPAAAVTEGEDSGDETSGDEEGDEDGDDMDEDERARLAALQGAREDIADMERQLATLHEKMELQANPILKKRIRENIEKVKAELQLKKSNLGEEDED